MAQVVFPRAGGREPHRKDGKLIGSRLIGQRFSDPKYFWGRPSATAPQPYNGLASGGSESGAAQSGVARCGQGEREGRCATPIRTIAKPIPVELVTASASGLDPEISWAAAALPSGARGSGARICRSRGHPGADPAARAGPCARVHRRAPDQRPGTQSWRSICCTNVPEATSAVNPDELLAALKRDEARARRGRLKIFFGASAGVGKTYSMLEAARAARASGAESGIGYVEPHGRARNRALAGGAGAAAVPRGATTAASRAASSISTPRCARARRYVLVDELAHSNVVDGEPHPRHAKRWQDVEEIARCRHQRLDHAQRSASRRA